MEEGEGVEEVSEEEGGEVEEGKDGVAECAEVPVEWCDRAVIAGVVIINVRHVIHVSANTLDQTIGQIKVTRKDEVLNDAGCTW